MWNAKSTFISLVASISSKVPALHRRTIQPPDVRNLFYE